MPESAECALVILAAGGSSRMGRPKQRLDIGGRTLLRQVVEATLPVSVAPYVVVLGAQAELIQADLKGVTVYTVVNDDWEQGIASSIRCGVEAVTSLAPSCTGIVIALADQPGLDAEKIEAILTAHRRSGRTIVAARSRGLLQPPVYFAAEFFPTLMALRGDAGARAILDSNFGKVEAVPMEGLGDIDTAEDYLAYIADRA